jgi:rhodanese-related sulfurtransferase
MLAAMASEPIEVSAARAAELQAAGAQLVDVRESYEREAGHIAGSRHIELAALSAAAPTIERERTVVFYCRVGARSAMAADAYRSAGYNASSLAGGLLAWVRAGLPLTPEGGHVADH